MTSLSSVIANLLLSDQTRRKFQRSTKLYMPLKVNLCLTVCARNFIRTKTH